MGLDDATIERAYAPTEAPAQAAAFKRVESKEGSFSFEQPAAWITAYNRSKPGPGALLLSGDFKSLDTFSIVRAQPEQFNLPKNGPGAEQSPDAVADKLLADQISSATTMRFELLNASQQQHADQQTYYTAEYKLETCRGEPSESLNGVKRCVGPKGQDLQTLKRHHLSAVSFAQGYAYVLNASATQEHWPAVAPALHHTVETFKLDEGLTY
ncbi:hypothetical protein WJX72_007185 [[Myrmecia] bisecta]|uniref:PsbP C-terminal domain-containing protein n=1 Tax=[Myrmecia] bisecta TaxID=41462 RepID=A0AAW1Q9D9_9CHLO